MKTRKRGGAKGDTRPPAKSVKKKVQNDPDSVIIPSKFNDPKRMKFNPETTHVIHNNPYYKNGIQPEVITTNLSDEEFIKRFNESDAYYKLDKKMRPELEDKTNHGQIFSKKKFRKVLNLMMTPKFVEIKTKLREQDIPEATNEEIRKIAKFFCKTKPKEKFGEGSALISASVVGSIDNAISSKFTEEQQKIIFDTIINEADTSIVENPIVEEESNESFCNIMGGKRNPKAKTKKRTRTRTRRRKTKRRRNLS